MGENSSLRDGSFTRKAPRRFSLLLVAVLLVAVVMTDAHSLSVGTSVVKVKTDGSVEAHIEVVVVQNITALISSFKLPIITTRLDSGNASGAMSAITEALRSNSPGVQLDSASIQVSSTDWDPFDKEQILRVTLDLKIRGVSEPNRSVLLVDLGWKNLTVQQEIKPQDISLNRIGESYLEAGFESIRDIPQPVTTSLSWLLEGRISTPVAFLAAVPNATLIDLSGLSPPVETWTSSFDFPTATTRWSLSGGNFDMRVAEEKTLPDGTKEEANYGARSLATIQVQAPGSAEANGNMVRIDAGNGLEETLMGAVIVSLVGVMTVGFFAERRLTSRRPVRKRQSR